MPLYDYQCANCGAVQEVFLQIRNLDLPQDCRNCGTEMTRQLSAVRGHGDFEEYNCPITGRLIRGKRQHLENLKRHNKRVLEPGERDDVARFHREQDQKIDRLAEKAVVEAVETMPAEKLEILAGELTRGGDADFVRQTANG